MWDARGATLAAYTHTAAGNMERHVAGDGIATGTFTYNLREWVTEIDYPGKFTVEQQYDGVGNVTSQRYKRAASESRKAAAYSYDRLHRLTAFNLSGGQTRYYRYDRNGNLLDMQTNGSYTLYRYPNTSTPNRVSEVYGGGLYIQTTYNPNGWITSLSRNALTYDYRGLLTGHGSAAYTMDPDRRRVKKTAGTAVTYYLRGADGSVLAEYDGGQALTARYVYAGSRRIARVAGSGTSYYLADHLGSTRSLIDEAGNVTAAYDYWPYGKMLATSGTDATRFRFTGHERDDESRLDYMLERSYAYDIGRFLRPDPMQDEYPGISPYVYAANNPLKYVDPDGRRIRLLGGASARTKLFSLIAKNLTPQEKENVGIKYDKGRNEYRVWTMAGYEGTSKAFGYLREVVNHPAYVDIRMGESIVNTAGQFDVSDKFSGGVTQLGKEGSSVITISPKGNPTDRVANPDHIVLAHELFGHSRLHQKGDPEARSETVPNAVETEIRKEQGLGPKVYREHYEADPIEVIAPRY